MQYCRIANAGFCLPSLPVVRERVKRKLAIFRELAALTVYTALGNDTGIRRGEVLMRRVAIVLGLLAAGCGCGLALNRSSYTGEETRLRSLVGFFEESHKTGAV